MFRNRVDPWGNIEATSARGTWMGTRGLIHNDRQEIERAFRLKPWLICLLQFKGRRRQVMTPGLYTELFFLDEVTALSAGHRPCCECRKPDFKLFKEAWIRGNPEYDFTMRTSIRQFDDIIHGQRINPIGQKVTFFEKIDDLPNGVFVELDGNAFLYFDKKFFPWSFFGYGEAIDTLAYTGSVKVLTPYSVVNAIRAGYVPENSIAK